MQPFMSGFFYLAQCFQGDSHCSVYQYFFPFYGQIIFHCIYNIAFCLTNYQLIDIWVVYTFWLLQIMMQLTFIYVFMYHQFCITSFLWYKLRDIAGSYDNFILIFWETARLFFTVVTSFYITTEIRESSNISTSSSIFVIFLFFFLMMQ